jgi:hypothetical protein
MKAISSTLAGNIVPAVSYTAGSYTLTGLVIGTDYYFTMGANDTSIAFASGSTFLKSARATGIFTATATTATLAGTGTSAVGTAIYPLCGTHLMAATVTPTQPARQVTIGNFPSNNPNFSRQVQISDQFAFVKRGTYAVAISIADIVNMALTQEPNLTWSPPVILTQPASATAAATAPASGTLTWDNAAGPSDGDTVTIGGKVYTFKTTLTPTEGQVLLNGGGDAALLNLIRAINHTGTPDTDYKCAAANTQVTAAASVTSHQFAVTAITSGVAGNAIATTDRSAHLSWGAATLTGGTVAAATFTVSPGSEYDLTYLWQYSVDGTTWATATGTINGTTYTNGTTATLTATPTTPGNSGYFLRCVVTDNAGSFGLTNGIVNTDGNATLTIP